MGLDGFGQFGANITSMKIKIDLSENDIKSGALREIADKVKTSPDVRNLKLEAWCPSDNGNGGEWKVTNLRGVYQD